jgi:predicted MFS family arabinose efflux permease
MLQSTFSSVETRRSWVVAAVALLIMAIAFGAPWITLVALKDIAAEVRGERSIPAFASALMWIGSGVGGILMGRIAERIGIRFTVIFGSLMVALGLALSSFGPSLPLYIGHGLFMGLLGIGGINAPFYVYVSRWFDRRRGSALALISSGAYLAGALWPPIFARLSANAGWRHAMLYYAVFELLLIVPAAALVLAAPPQEARHPRKHEVGPSKSVLGWPPNLVFALQMEAIFTCCIPMAMPQTHLVAFCSDLGISAAHGAAMLSVLLGSAFFSRQLWGVISDRRPLHHARRIGLPGGRHGGLSAHSRGGRIVHGRGAVRRRIQRTCAGKYSDIARIVSGRGRLLAHADIAVVQRLGHGGGRLARRNSLRSFRLLRARLCGRACGQYPQLHFCQHAGAATQNCRARLTKLPE